MEPVLFASTTKHLLVIQANAQAVQLDAQHAPIMLPAHPVNQTMDSVMELALFASTTKHLLVILVNAQVAQLDAQPVPIMLPAHLASQTMVL